MTPTTDSSSASSENLMASLLTSGQTAPSEFAGTWAKPPMGLKAADVSKRREYLAWRTQIEEQATKEEHIQRRAAAPTPLARAKSIGQSASWKTLGSCRWPTEETSSQLFDVSAAALEQTRPSAEQDRGKGLWLW